MLQQLTDLLWLMLSGRPSHQMECFIASQIPTPSPLKTSTSRNPSCASSDLLPSQRMLSLKAQINGVKQDFSAEQIKSRAESDDQAQIHNQIIQNISPPGTSPCNHWILSSHRYSMDISGGPRELAILPLGRVPQRLVLHGSPPPSNGEPPHVTHHAPLIMGRNLPYQPTHHQELLRHYQAA